MRLRPIRAFLEFRNCGRPMPFIREKLPNESHPEVV
jgi:hypothetical protein